MNLPAERREPIRIARATKASRGLTGVVDHDPWAIARIVNAAAAIRHPAEGFPGAPPTWPCNEPYFAAAPVVGALQRLRLRPVQSGPGSWSWRCPLCRSEPATGRLVVIGAERVRVFCHAGCPPSLIRDLIERAA